MRLLITVSTLKGGGDHGNMCDSYLGQLLGLGELLVDFLGEVLLRLERGVRHDVLY